MNIQTLMRRIENRKSQIAWEIRWLEAEEKRLMEEKDVIERDIFINLQIDSWPRAAT